MFGADVALTRWQFVVSSLRMSLLHRFGPQRNEFGTGSLLPSIFISPLPAIIRDKPDICVKMDQSCRIGGAGTCRQGGMYKHAMQ
ncbi:hypothetical protein A0H81_14555 [Grifola frondosa]|uniref:Uncharacterized protein n=1 Tax=Grifola frondosa TaxID=5627 RepID=A0A1C7LL67_GRIFR|nr:hypothetical protein A0H81_14555 [Grifola frondosa]